MTHKPDVLSPEIRTFISRTIDSVTTLELLLLLYRKQDREWTVDQATAELRSSPSAIEARLEQLQKRGLLVKGNPGFSYRYAPSSTVLNKSVELLSQIYSQYQIRIIDQIYSPQKKAAQEFADAFKLKREDDNG